MSRIYLNVHGTNQVMLGFILGAYFLMIYLIVVEDFLLKIIYNLDQTCYEEVSFKIKRILALLVIYIIFLAIPVIIYVVMRDSVVMKKSWIKNIEA